MNARHQLTCHSFKHSFIRLSSSFVDHQLNLELGLKSHFNLAISNKQNYSKRKYTFNRLVLSKNKQPANITQLNLTESKFIKLARLESSFAVWRQRRNDTALARRG